MNIEDLKNLKESLESDQKYVAIRSFTYKEIMASDEAKPLSEFISKENTEEVIKRCESLIEESVRALAEKNIPFDYVTLSSELGFLCKESFIEKVKSFYKNNRPTEESYLDFVEELKKQASSIYVPLSFYLNTSGTGTDDKTMIDYELEEGYSFGDISKHDAVGIVNLEEFMSKMKELGYGVNLLNYGECHNFDDYIQAVIKNEFDTQIDIVADLTKKEGKDFGTR